MVKGRKCSIPSQRQSIHFHLYYRNAEITHLKNCSEGIAESVKKKTHTAMGWTSKVQFLAVTVIFMFVIMFKPAWYLHIYTTGTRGFSLGW
jgi:hypothetical protein